MGRKGNPQIVLNLEIPVSLGIELCREQSANITAVKFPVKRQISAACHNCKVSTDDVNGGVPNEVDPIIKSKQVSFSYSGLKLSSNLWPHHTEMHYFLFNS